MYKEVVPSEDSLVINSNQDQNSQPGFKTLEMLPMNSAQKAAFLKQQSENKIKVVKLEPLQQIIPTLPSLNKPASEKETKPIESSDNLKIDKPDETKEKQSEKAKDSSSTQQHMSVQANSAKLV